MIERINKVFASLRDEESRKLFLNRLLFVVTGEYSYMLEEIRKLPEGSAFSDLLEHTPERYLFGCGDLGRRMAKTWGGWRGFIDNDPRKQGKQIENLYVFRPDEIDKDAFVFVSTRLYYRAVVKELLSMGVEENRIINVGEIADKMAEHQYFDLPVLTHSDKEVFVDCGALDGETTSQFVKWTEQRYGFIYMFEPDSENIKKCKSFKRGNDIKCDIINKAVWCSIGRVGFESLNNGGSNINELSMESVETTTIDDVVGGKYVSFIKMDIEGAEYEAITGAKETIKRYRPKLAICVYHKENDIITIPELILEINPDYRLYLRHYSLTASETVLYAI